jgi:hypothetical protein
MTLKPKAVQAFFIGTIFYFIHTSCVFSKTIELSLKKYSTSSPAFVASSFERVVSTTSAIQTPVQKVEFSVSPQELSDAGFIDVVKLSPVGKRFEAPVEYFRIAEQIPVVTSSVYTDCEDCSSLVLVYITEYATSSPVWANKENPMITTIDNRFHLKISVANRVLFIISSQEEAMFKLMQHLRERIILNKKN